MDRRHFLKLGLGSVALAGLSPADQGLVDVCRARAAELHWDWTPRMERRVMEEAAEIEASRGVEGILRIAEAVRPMRDAGILFAPALARSGSSLIARLLGITEVNPLDHDIAFDAVVPGKESSTLSLGVGVEERAVPALLDRLRPETVERYDILHYHPDGWKAGVRGVDLLIHPIIGMDRVLSEDPAGYREDRLLMPFRSFMVGFAAGPTIPPLALGLTMFRFSMEMSGIAEAVIDVRQGRRHPSTFGPASTYGFPIYREDVQELLMRELGVTRWEALRAIRAWRRKRPAEMRPIEELLLSSATRHGKSEERARDVVNVISWQSGYLYPKAVSISEAMMTHSAEPRLRRLGTLWHCHGSESCLDWAWSLARIAQRYDPDSWGISSRWAASRCALPPLRR